MDTILLVDDNPLRAAMRKSILEGNAPAVVRALDASEALCMVESAEFARRLTLVITGHVTTGISGPEFVAELRSRMPQVPVLVLSMVADAEPEYRGIPGVYISRTTFPDELRSLVSRLILTAERQTA
jgi:CheY-like chemotaxis protein